MYGEVHTNIYISRSETPIWLGKPKYPPLWPDTQIVTFMVRKKSAYMTMNT